MARSRDPWRLVAAGCLLACACEVAAAAPPPERAARRAEREARRAARGARQARPAPARAASEAPPATPPARAATGPAAPPAPPPAAGACPPDNPLTFRSFGAGFLRTWCTGCHSSTLPERERQEAPLDVNFDAHALYLPHAAAVYERAVVEAHAHAADPGGAASPMPPAGLVPEAERRRLAQWIACGSPLP